MLFEAFNDRETGHVHMIVIPCLNCAHQISKMGHSQEHNPKYGPKWNQWVSDVWWCLLLCTQKSDRCFLFSSLVWGLFGDCSALHTVRWMHSVIFQRIFWSRCRLGCFQRMFLRGLISNLYHSFRILILKPDWTVSYHVRIQHEQHLIVRYRAPV